MNWPFNYYISIAIITLVVNLQSTFSELTTAHLVSNWHNISRWDPTTLVFTSYLNEQDQIVSWLCQTLHNVDIVAKLSGQNSEGTEGEAGSEQIPHSFQMFLINFFGEFKTMSFPALLTVCGAAVFLLGIPDTFLPPPLHVGTKKNAVSVTKHISWMVGNEPHLGGQRNIIVCPSLNCCWVNKQRRLSHKNGGVMHIMTTAGLQHFCESTCTRG